MTLTPDEALEIAVEGYAYAYPLVLMDVSRRVMTNVEAPAAASSHVGAPMNQFAHLRTFPDSTFTDVVRPNADTLYSALWFDVSREPLVVGVPDSEGRYYLLPMLDMWTDVFASPGTRTTGNGAQTFALVGPRWTGATPAGMDVVRSPTGMGWMVGRTQANGPDDFARVHDFQAGLTAVPASAWGKPYTAPKGKVDASVSRLAPVDQVAKMDARTFFGRFADLVTENPPHGNDYPILARLSRIGIAPGRSFDSRAVSAETERALERAVPVAHQKILEQLERSPRIVNNWSMIVPPVGTYGTAYRDRACIAFFGLGANVSEDAIYPTATMDADGRAFESDGRYVLRFSRDQIPPVRAFWSLTMYDGRQLFADNPIGRYAIGDRDRLTFDADGALTLYIQRESPGKEREGNWLPTPATGGFSMNLRLYWPRPEALDGTWTPPAVRRVA
jgi:hypothetical protein